MSSHFPNAFDTPVWYLFMPLSGEGKLFTEKRYASILAGRLNDDQRNAMIKVEEYTFMPDAIHLIIREGALQLEMWWEPFKDAILKHLPEGAAWGNCTYERISDAAAFEHRAFEMLYLPVWKGLASDPNGYAYNSVNNRAKIDL
ncbi:MAG TPA: hypothetical protein VJ720_06185 [Chitinophaga sp.]|nr:hypothetical protein [Chitinophaga sp.]